MWQEIETARVAIARFLQRSLFKTKYFPIDLWSFVHLILSFLTMALLIKFDVGNSFIVFISLIVVFEIIENFIARLNSKLIKPESLPGILYDIVVDIAGALAAIFLAKFINLY